MNTSALRLGIDIGGTFTDLLMLDEKTGRLSGRVKTLTTVDPSEGAMAGVSQLQSEAGVNDAVGFVCHATTVITNALLQRQTARGGLITTRGFRDVLEIARMVRPVLYDLNVERIPPLIPRDRIKELSERVLSDGSVLRPLDRRELDAAIRALLAEDVECIAVCLINSYANRNHEREVAARIRELAPNIPVCISTDLVQEYREYQRMSSAVVNAVTMPAFAGYIRRFGERLIAERISAPLYLMQSNGGMMLAESASPRPINFVESGPAAGVIGAARLGALTGHPNILSFDMGGTTAKVGLIQNGAPLTTSEYSVGGPTHGRAIGAAATGYPIRVPVLDLVEIGTGGGSIASVDPAGRLRVGPESAGANPGPMCYGRGGDSPTVTDAHVVTGVIDPANFLGGRMRLDADRAHRGIELLSRKLGMDVLETAQGIIDIADAAMVGALRVMSVERGVDPREFALVAFGGAGPMRATSLAKAIGVKTVIIPAEPGLFAAFGLLLTDVRRDEIRSFIKALGQVSIDELVAAIDDVVARADNGLANEGLAHNQRTISRAVDLRYRGQSYELTVSLPDGPIGPETLKKLADSFHEMHTTRYGYSSSNAPIQIVSVRASAVGRLPPVTITPAESGDGNPARALTGKRHVTIARHQTVEVPVYDRHHLLPGDRLDGPAVLEQFDSTILILAGQVVTVDQYSNLFVRTFDA